MSLLLALAMLLSCAAAIAEESENVAIPEAKEGETVIEFWCGMWETWNQNWVKAQVDSWNAKEDRPFYVNLTWMDTSTMAQQLAAARAAEIAPDVYTTDYSSVANDYANGYTLDLTNLVSQSAWDDLLDSAKSFVTIHDALVAYPWMMEPSIVMYYDKEAFTSVGLDPESPPTTWDELIEYAEMLTTEDRFGMDIAASYNFWGWFYTNNNDQYMLTDDWSAANVNNESMKQHLIKRKVTGAFQLLMVADRFYQFFQPFTHRVQFAPHSREQGIDVFHSIVVIAQLGVDALFFQSKSSRAKMNLRCHLNALPLEGSHIDPFCSSCLFQGCVLLHFPFMPPYLTILPIVPIHGVHADALPLSVFAHNAVSVFIQGISRFCFVVPMSLLVHGAHGAKNMGMRIGRIAVLKMHRQIDNHTLINKLCLAVMPYQVNVILNG